MKACCYSLQRNYRKSITRQKKVMGKGWLMIDVKDNINLYHDILKLIRIRWEINTTI
ncbi:hypothetical protein [Blautia hominis]|uniref:hypothetical protein n=1 Tax=Blautia hominis TaxID=2025493 RepID=UPI0036F40514